MLREVVYKDRDNAIDLLLKADGSAKDISGTTKVWLELNTGSIIKSEEEAAGTFDWATDGANGKLKLKLGSVTALVAGSTYEVELILFDIGNTNGIDWGKFSIEVE